MTQRVFALLCLMCAFPLAAMADLPREKVTIIAATGEHVFDVEIADDPEERAMGLMHRKHLAQDSGMLFLFPRPRQIVMWMKNTHITLDMLFVTANGVIVNIARETTPFSLEHIMSEGEAKGVLEINGGLADKLGIKPGDRIIANGLGGP